MCGEANLADMSAAMHVLPGPTGAKGACDE